MPHTQSPSTDRQGPRSLPLSPIHRLLASEARQAVGSNQGGQLSNPKGRPQPRAVGGRVVQRAGASQALAGCLDPAPGSALLKKVRVPASGAKRRISGKVQRTLEEIRSTLRSDENRPPKRRISGEVQRTLEEIRSTLRLVPLVALVTVAGCHGVIERDPRGVFGGFKTCDGGPAYCESRNRPWSGRL